MDHFGFVGRGAMKIFSRTVLFLLLVLCFLSEEVKKRAYYY